MTSIGQQITRELLQSTLRFSQIIENYRPAWLYGMELDFWLPELKLGVEFQGDQHYAPVFGHSAYQSQAIRDRRKKQLCFENGVLLVRLDAYELQPTKVIRKIKLALGAMYPNMGKGERKHWVRRIVKHRKQRNGKTFAEQKAEYCQFLKARFGSLTVHKRKSAIREKIREAAFAAV